MENLKEVIMLFYTKCLAVNEETDVEKVMEKLLADNFKSVNTA